MTILNRAIVMFIALTVLLGVGVSQQARAEDPLGCGLVISHADILELAHKSPALVHLMAQGWSLTSSLEEIRNDSRVAYNEEGMYMHRPDLAHYVMIMYVTMYERSDEFFNATDEQVIDFWLRKFSQW